MKLVELRKKLPVFVALFFTTFCNFFHLLLILIPCCKLFRNEICVFYVFRISVFLLGKYKLKVAQIL